MMHRKSCHGLAQSPAQATGKPPSAGVEHFVDVDGLSVS